MTSRIIAIANQKGGVGKTTTTLGLAAAIADSGQRVLVIDMDPQSNASQTLLADHAERLKDDDFYTSNDILDEGVEPGDIVEAITSTGWEGVDLIPSRPELVNREVTNELGVEMRLRGVITGLDDLPVPYDVVLIDCPPSVGRLTVNALLSAGEVLLIAHPDSYGQSALDAVDSTIKKVRNAYRHDIVVSGIVINMYEDTTEARLRSEQLRERYGNKVLLTMRKRAVMRAAQGNHQSVFDMQGDPAAREVAGWFRDLARTLEAVKAVGVG
jgi:chromosome partitioning protein